MQQRGVLRHHADLAAQRLLRDLRDVLAVDEDAPALEVVEAQEQVDERRLAGAGAADEADLLARPDGQREVLDDLRLPAVVEAGVLEADLAARRPRAPGVGPVD